MAGFCKSATLDEISSHGHALTPGRYAGAEEVADDGEPFAQKMNRLVAELAGPRAEATRCTFQPPSTSHVTRPSA